MNKKALWLYCVFLMLGIAAYPQCNQRLVEQSAELAGSDAIYLRDFKVKLSGGNMENPSPTGKYPVYLNKGVTYRFTVANANEFEGKAIVELAKRGQVYSGNYNFESKEYLNSFDLECTQSSTYQLLVNFGEEKEGCAAIVMSMVLQDSMTYIEPKPGLPTESDSNGVFYKWFDNKLQIASTAGKNAEIQVSVSQGKLRKQGKDYIIRPDTIGNLMVKARIYLDGKLVEYDSVDYLVELPPLPTILLPGENIGVLNVKDFNGLGEIDLYFPYDVEFNPYKLMHFSISTDRAGFSSYISNGENLSPQQINCIKKLKPNDKFYIMNAVFIDPEGKEHTSNQREIFIVDY